MSNKGHFKCVCCGSPAELMVALRTRNDRNENERYSFPCSPVLAASPETDHVGDTPFCKICMHSVEDAMRATIRNLQYEHGRNEKRFRQNTVQ